MSTDPSNAQGAGQSQSDSSVEEASLGLTATVCMYLGFPGSMYIAIVFSILLSDGQHAKAWVIAPSLTIMLMLTTGKLTPERWIGELRWTSWRRNLGLAWLTTAAAVLFVLALGLVETTAKGDKLRIVFFVSIAAMSYATARLNRLATWLSAPEGQRSDLEHSADMMAQLAKILNDEGVRRGRGYGVQVEGHGHAIRIDEFAYVAALGANANPGHEQDLLVSSDDTGQLASAVVQHRAPPETAASRPGGPIADAGIIDISAGPTGPWRVCFGELRFTFPASLMLRVVPDNHPGSGLPFYLSKAVDTDEVIQLFGEFEEGASEFAEFIHAGQEVVRHEHTPHGQELDVRYKHEGQTWRACHFWVEAPGGLLVIKSQTLESSGPELSEIATELRDELAVKSR